LVSLLSLEGFVENLPRGGEIWDFAILKMGLRQFAIK